MNVVSEEGILEAESALVAIRVMAHAVISLRSDHVGTHYQDCWLVHPECFAQAAINRAERALDFMGVPK